ncbi:MAG: uracil-DNA glycosylase [Firmicutes bacterium]|nr:uracil-DNA glycosylase [Bacillota bacterium]
MREKYLFDYLVVPGQQRKYLHYHQTKEQKLSALAEVVNKCQACSLRKKATQVVFGAGNPEAKLMLVGEAPGAEEDKQGLPFVGVAGQLLNKILAAVEIKREEVYLANILKCRPPANRQPSEKEIKLCLPHLLEQIKIIDPQIIVCLGAVAAKALVNPEARISLIRGKWFEYGNARLMATFHPAALLRDQSKKRFVWYDMQKVRDAYRLLI